MSTLHINPKIIMPGNGERVWFPFGFPVNNKAQIKVVIYRGATESERELSLSEFEFDPAVSPDVGGEVLFPISESQEVLSADDKICILRQSVLGNDYTFSNQTRLFPSSVEDADDALSLQIMELARDLALSVKASVFDERTPEARWEEIRAELKRAQDILNFVDEEVLTMPSKLQEESLARQTQDAAILATVAQNKIECEAKADDVSARLANETQARKDADDESVKKVVVPSVVSTVTPLFSESRVAINVTKKDTGTGALSDSIVALPVASEEQHGVMPREMVVELSRLGAKVSALEGESVQTYALHLGVDPLTQEEYQLAWEQAAGVSAGSVPPNGTKLVNLDDNTEVQYFSTNQPTPWVVRGASTVPLATNISSGVVKGEPATKGKIAVEADGTMSMVGYDELASDVSSVASSIVAEQERAQQSEANISGSLTSHVNDNERHVSAEERASWNSKYTKPDSGIPSADLDANVQQKINTAVTTTGGGTMAAQLVARNTNPASAFEVRNIKAVSTDPGVGSALATGNILFVYE